MKATVAELEKLRPEIIQRIQSMPTELLLKARNALLDLEIQRSLDDLDGMFDEDRAAGKFDPAEVEAAIREHRQKHPYGE